VHRFGLRFLNLCDHAAGVGPGTIGLAWCAGV
jgi:hypothetical protein